jgi:hypothetical protein
MDHGPLFGDTVKAGIKTGFIMRLMTGEHAGRIFNGFLVYNFSIKPGYRNIDGGRHAARQAGAPDSAGNHEIAASYTGFNEKEFEAVRVHYTKGVVCAVIGARCRTKQYCGKHKAKESRRMSRSYHHPNSRKQKIIN